MKGKPRTLFTWLGKSERPVPMIRSGRTAKASSGMISGHGLAMASTTGSRAIRRIISGVKAPLAESPIRMSAPSHSSSSVCRPSSGWA